jgi:hypothetical protein
MILVLHLFSNNHKGVKMMYLVKSNTWLGPWKKVCNFIMVQQLHHLCRFITFGWYMGLTIKATPPRNEMMQDFYLQISITQTHTHTYIHIYMSLMNHLFFMHKFSMFFLKWSKVIMKVVLGKEPKSHWVVVDTLDDYNDTSDVMFQLETLL